MRTHTFSIVVGTAACNAACPFCVSKMSRSEACKLPRIDEQKFNTACRVVQQARDGLVSVILTGKGEPLLFPKMISQYLDLINLGDFQFPIIELQTNGLLIQDAKESFRRWYDQGLNKVCISIAHWSHNESNRLMGINGSYNFWDDVLLLKQMGYVVRLNCTMLKNSIDTPHAAEKLFTHCQDAGVDQLTLREVDMPHDASGDVAEYIKQQKPHGAATRLHHYLAMSGATQLLTLPHGGIIYDYNGQNVCISNCLTETTDPDDIRQLIFFPDGRLSFSWQYPAARLL
jgi:molybdenum cofactor biosynthesis enzyme MoaA